MDARQRDLGLKDNDEYPVWRLHPNRVFSNECPECSNPNSPGCPIAKGRNSFHLFVLRSYVYFFCTNWFCFPHSCRDVYKFRLT